MLKDITFGQYFPGGSILHKLDPRIKILSVILLIVWIFLAEHILSYALMLFTCIVLILIASLPLKTVFRSIRGIFIILLIKALINLFLTKGEGKPLVDWGVFSIYEEGNRSQISESGIRELK